MARVSGASFFRDVLEHLYDAVYLVDLERRITYWNKAAERISGYSAQDAIGSLCCDNILAHINANGGALCDGLCPLAMTLADGQPREAEIFLHHKDGHRIPVCVHVSPLFDEEGHLIGAAEIFNDNTSRQQMRTENEHLRKLALLDELTEIGNRRFAEMQIDTDMSEASRYGWPFGLLFVDIDRFKTVNDAHGHAAGDRVIRMVASVLSAAVRSYDTVCRWGGDEFVTLVKRVDADMLSVVAEKLRMLAENSAIDTNAQPVRATLSIGGTIFCHSDTRDSLIRRADRLMYEGKMRGGNTVVMG